VDRASDLRTESGASMNSRIGLEQLAAFFLA
jgi:hypothetical protein